MALGHEKLDVYRLAIGYVAWVFEPSEKWTGAEGKPSNYGSDPDFDSDFDPDEKEPQPDAALNADRPRE